MRKIIGTPMMIIFVIILFFGRTMVSIQADEDSLFEVHYYMPGNVEEPVAIPDMLIADLKADEYTQMTFELTAEDCEEYFNVMEERNSVEFQLRFTGMADVYINRISWGFKGEDPQTDMSGDSLKKFIWEEEKIAHTDLKLSEELADEDFLAWDETEKALAFYENEDAYEGLISKNAIWGMEKANVKDSGKSVVLTIWAKLGSSHQQTENTKSPELSTQSPEKSSQPVNTTSAPVTENPQEQSQSPSPSQSTDTDSPNSSIIWIIIGAAVLCAAAGTGIVIIRKKNK